MQKRHYHMGLTGLGVLAILGLVWLGHPTSRPLAPESSALSLAPAVSPAPVIQAEAVAPEAVQPADLQAVKAELTVQQQQQRDALATLQQQQKIDLAALQQRLEGFFAEQRALTRRLDDLARRAANSGDEFLTEADTAAADLELTADQIAQYHEEDAEDPAWSAQAQISIQESFDRFRGELPETAFLLDTHCRTSVCRMEVAVEGDVDRDQVFMYLPHIVPWNNHGLLHFDAEAQTVIFYVSREGTSLTTAR